LNYIKRIPKNIKPLKWEEKIPDANPQAIDLLKKMLKFNPERRITIKEAIEHPYFSNYA
jgi:serine/threonine protein kinase